MLLEDVSATTMNLLHKRIEEKIKWLSRGVKIEVFDVDFYRDMNLVNSYRAVIKYKYK